MNKNVSEKIMTREQSSRKRSKTAEEHNTAEENESPDELLKHESEQLHKLLLHP